MLELHEECGIVGVLGDNEAANVIYLGLYALQHRGQEACGIVTFANDKQTYAHKTFGLVVDGMTKDALAKLPGSVGIGHVRYSTQGGKSVQNIQPFSFNSSIGPVAIAHNGNLTNAKTLRTELEASGSIFQSTSDSEVFMHLIARSKARSIRERISEVMQLVKGAYSLVISTPDKLFAVRDPFGFRPLVLGKRAGAWIVASETCALDLIDATFEREIAPGELAEFTAQDTNVSFPAQQRRGGFCAFEPIYFARPDSRIFGQEMYRVRKQIGAVLAKESHVDADVVIAIPDSGVPMAMGYSEACGLPLETGLVRNHYVGRTFIEPTQAIRDFGVKLKLNPVRSVLEGRRVVVVDDSIVRGTTSLKIIRMLRIAGAKEIHMRIGSPPITHSCFFGVDTPERSKLLAAQKNVEEMLEFVGADSLAFLSIAGLQKALGGNETAAKYCYGCFSGSYPEDICVTVPPQPTDKNGPGLRAARR